MTPMTPICKT